MTMPAHGDLLLNTWLSFAVSHKWLGAAWKNDLDQKPHLFAEFRKAGAAFASFLGMVTAGVVPIPNAMVLFQQKVDCRWRKVGGVTLW